MRLFRSESIAERFSGKPIRAVDITGRSGSQLKIELANARRWSSNLAQELLASGDLKNPSRERVNTILVQARDFGIRDYEPDYNVVTHKAQKEGLSLCPQTTGAELALLDADFIENGMWADVLSKPISGRRGAPGLFGLYRGGGSLELDGRWTGNAWDPGYFVVAGLR